MKQNRNGVSGVLNWVKKVLSVWGNWQVINAMAEIRQAGERVPESMPKGKLTTGR